MLDSRVGSSWTTASLGRSVRAGRGGLAGGALSGCSGPGVLALMSLDDRLQAGHPLFDGLHAVPECLHVCAEGSDLTFEIVAERTQLRTELSSERAAELAPQVADLLLHPEHLRLDADQQRDPDCQHRNPDARAFAPPSAAPAVSLADHGRSVERGWWPGNLLRWGVLRWILHRRGLVDVLAERGWTTPATLGRWLGLGAANLTKRHLSPMIAEGVLERLYPERVNHPEQAYRVKPGRSDDP